MKTRVEVYSFKGRRTPRWIKALIALVLAGVLCFCMLFGAVMHGSYDHINGQPQIMVILGCQVMPWGPSILLQDRLDEGLAYLREYPDMTVVVSGGQGTDEHLSEAQAMANYLMEHGIPEENILLEDQSHNTVQTCNTRPDFCASGATTPPRTSLWCPTDFI